MRKLLVLLLLVFIGMSSVALAQDTPTVFCGDLSESDCGLLRDSAAIMQGLSSAGFNFALDMSMNNPMTMGRGPGSNLSLRIEGTGAYALDRAGLPQDILSPQAMTENLEQLPQLLDQVLKAFSADAKLTLFLPPELAAMAGQPLPDKAGLSFRMVDGIAYINLEKLAELDTSGSVPRGWMGFDVAGLVSQALEQQMGSLGSSLNMSPLTGINNQELANQFSTITRLPDANVGGHNVAVFETNIDMGTMMSSPELAENLRESMRQNLRNSGMSEAEVERTLDQMMPMMAQLYAGMEFKVTQSIGIDDRYVHQMTMSIAWPFDMGSLTGQRGQSLDVSMGLVIGLDQFNAAPEISAPDDAIMIPLEGMLTGSPQM